MLNSRTLASKIQELVRSRKGEIQEQARDSIIWWSKKLAHIVIVALATILLLGIGIAIGSLILSGLYGEQVAGVGVAVLTMIGMFIFVVYFAAYWIDQPTILDNDELFDIIDEMVQDENAKIRAEIDNLANSIDYLTNLLEAPDGDSNGNQ